MSSSDRIAVDDAFGIDSVVQMESLLGRRDIADLPADGWMAVVAICNTGMVGAESGEFDASEWADLLVRALDKANACGRLDQSDVLRRRMVACAAALNYFGVCEGSPVRDPKEAFLWLVAELGGSRDELMFRCGDLAGMRAESTPVEDAHRAMKWRSSVVGALRSLCKIAQYMNDLTLMGEALEWCKMADEIPDVGVRRRHI